MRTFETIVDYLAAPPRFFALMLVTFLACRGWKWPWSRVGGWALFVLATLFMGAGLSDDRFRHLILHPERLPVTLLVVASMVVLWLEMRRLALSLRGPDGESSGDKGTERAAMPGLSPADAAAAAIVGVALAACALLQPAALGPEADPHSRPDLVKVPWFFVGLQEIESYFDPWVPYLALPLLLVAGLLGLPYLRIGDTGAGRWRSLFLFGWLFVWLWPMVVGALLRGPHWNAFTPFQAWDPSRPAALAPRPLSEIFWIGWLRGFEPASWWLRELPGIFLLGVYFVLLPLVLRRWRVTGKAYDSYRGEMGKPRFRAALACLLALMVIPLKMYSRWLLDIGYWIYLPELSFNF